MTDSHHAAALASPGEDPNEPITVSVARRILPGHEADYEAWIHGISEVASQFPGHQGINVLRPGPATNGKYVLIYRFDSYRHGRDWEKSAERQQWIDKLDGISEGEAVYRKVTGLEFWFDLPEVPLTAKPSPHRMALVLVVVVFSLVYPLQLVVAPLLGELPVWGRVLCFVVFQVVTMTYVVMPQVTRLLKPWLYPSSS